MADGVSPVINTNLGPTTPGAAPMTAQGVVGIMSDLAEMRNRQNANILFQQQMAARHKLGEDLVVWGAQGLSPEEQIAKASHQIYAPLVTPELANFRASNLAGAQVELTQAQKAETLQRVANTGADRLVRTLAATGGDPKLFDGAFKNAIAGAPPEAAGAMRKYYGAFKESLTHDLPENPEEAKVEVKRRTAALGVSVGMPLDQAYGLVGAVPPQVVDVAGGGKSVVGGFPGQTPPALVPEAPKAGAPAEATEKSIDGTSLFAPDSMLPPQFKSNLTGAKTWQSAPLAENAKGLMEQWGRDQTKYEQTSQSNGTIANMLEEVKHNARNGGALTTGFAGDTRTMMANAVNTMYRVFNPGAAPPIDPQAIATNESIAKQAKTLAFQVVSQATGQSREALGTLQMGYDSVPNLDRTPLGNIIVGDVLHATGQWYLEQQKFKQDWIKRTNGDLNGADAAYIQLHPPERVVQSVLADHGIGPNGVHQGVLATGLPRRIADNRRRTPPRHGGRDCAQERLDFRRGLCEVQNR